MCFLLKDVQNSLTKKSYHELTWLILFNAIFTELKYEETLCM